MEEEVHCATLVLEAAVMVVEVVMSIYIGSRVVVDSGLVGVGSVV